MDQGILWPLQPNGDILPTRLVHLIEILPLATQIAVAVQFSEFDDGIPVILFFSLWSAESWFFHGHFETQSSLCAIPPLILVSLYLYDTKWSWFLILNLSSISLLPKYCKRHSKDCVCYSSFPSLRCVRLRFLSVMRRRCDIPVFFEPRARHSELPKYSLPSFFLNLIWSLPLAH